MRAKQGLLVLLIASAVMLAIGIGPRIGGKAYALPAPEERVPAGVTVPYPGRLDDEAGQPVTDGTYDFAFDLYASEIGGEPLWSEVQEGVMVQAGAFITSLGSASPIPAATLAGETRWLAVGVREAGEAGFTALTPRQRLSAGAPAAPDSPSAGAACEHDHWGEWWEGTDDVWGLYVSSPYGYGLWGNASISETAGVAGTNNWGDGVLGSSVFGSGVCGRSGEGPGVHGESAEGPAVHADGEGSGNALYASMAEEGSGDAVYAAQYGTGRAGFFGINNASNSQDALYATTSGAGRAGFFGISNASNGQPALYVTASGTGLAAYFDGDIHADNVSFSQLATFGINASEGALEAGDIVSVRGVRASELDNAAVLMEVGPAQPGETVIGVVQGRAELDAGEGSGSGEIAPRLLPREGAAEPGEHVTIITYGLAQVRADPASGPITAGTLLAASAAGQARALRTVEVDGVLLAESVSTVGVALEGTTAEGLIWVLVSPTAH